MDAYKRGNVTLVNAPGTGVADDKSVYAYVPDMIRYYLSEDPILENVDTHLCRRPMELEYTLDNLQDLVVKRVGESGGYGMLTGPHSTSEEREEYAKQVLANPADFISQPVLALSRSPCLVDGRFEPRHVDLRPFVLHGLQTRIVPGAFCRVALRRGSLVVNSSQGGGGQGLLGTGGLNIVTALKMSMGYISRSRAAVTAGILLLMLGFFVARPAVAYAAGVDSETQFILNTFMFLVWGALVMWMCAGFTMLESGAVRTKNASMICLKNIGLYSIAGLAYFFIGYNLMYVEVGRDLSIAGVDVGGLFGSFSLLYGPTSDEIALVGGDGDAAARVVESGRATMSDWFFQMVFVATAASIVSGAIAERIKMWSFFLFTLLLTALIYPVVGAWTWGGGWLTELGFKDFAGSTIVHSTGGWAALAGILVVGPRLGKYRRDGSIQPTPPSNVLVVTLGVFILWLGWFGFNGGSQLALGSAKDAVGMSHVLANTNLAAAAGVMAAIAVSRPILGRMDLFAGLNGAIAGLVSITAGPDIVDHHWAVVIGAVGGVICTAGIKLLERIKLDDVVGAIPAHLFAGIWGTLAVCIAAGGQLHIQLLGVVVIGVFVFSISWLLWRVLDMTLGLRVSRQAERLGQDVAELGIEAYPEFVLIPEEFDEED